MRPSQIAASAIDTRLMMAPRAVVPAAHVARIRTWVKYGMTIAHVAAVYGVDADEIVKLLGKHNPSDPDAGAFQAQKSDQHNWAFAGLSI